MFIPKNIVVCLDGTTNATEVAPGCPTPTNVLLFARALSKQDPSGVPQVVHYVRGVGTDESAGAIRRKVWAGGAGIGLSQQVQEAYEFLTNNYAAGDCV